MGGGQVLGGRYRLDEQLRAGGTATVWRGHDLVLDRRVAVKVLAADEAGDPGARLRIRDEARIAATLSHPNIAQVYDFGEAGERRGRSPYLVMELVDGPTLLERLATGPLPVREAVRICAEVAAALAEAHAAGLVHRDVKPANVILARTGAKVVDFGIAAAAGTLPEPSTEQEVFGTPAYIAPERLTAGRVEPASDVYSLGMLLYVLLAGRLPWNASTTRALLVDHVATPPAPLPGEIGAGARTAALCLACLAKEPSARPTAAAVAAALRAGDPGEPAAPPRAAAGIARRAGLIAAGMGLSAVGLVSVVALLPGPPPAPPMSPPGPSLVAERPPQAMPEGDPSKGPSAQPARGQQGYTFRYFWGSVSASCPAQNRARLESWEPARGYRVEQVDAGPAAAVAAVFRHGHDHARVEVFCADGTPKPVTVKY